MPLHYGDDLETLDVFEKSHHNSLRFPLCNPNVVMFQSFKQETVAEFINIIHLNQSGVFPAKNVFLPVKKHQTERMI